MADIMDAAKLFINLAQCNAEQNEGDPMTNLRLQKLLYFAQGWNFARMGKPLFADDFSAWPFGPVSLSVYNQFKSNERNPLYSNAPDDGALTRDELELLIDVYNAYEGYSTGALVDLSHRKGGPWDDTIKKESGKIIPKDKIAAWFKTQQPIPGMREKIKKIPVITPKRNTEGAIIAAGDDEDDWEE